MVLNVIGPVISFCTNIWVVVQVQHEHVKVLGKIGVLENTARNNSFIIDNNYHSQEKNIMTFRIPLE